ncbi:LGFP repeat-containing protein, partial [Leucobacter sp. MMO-125]
QEFERGTAYWSNRTGASVINGAIRGLYLSEGGPDGYLGLPVGAEVRANGVSRQEFERGTAYWSNGTGASVINGAIRGLYLSEGGPDGYLGLPVGAEVRANG